MEVDEIMRGVDRVACQNLFPKVKCQGLNDRALSDGVTQWVRRQAICD